MKTRTLCSHALAALALLASATAATAAATLRLGEVVFEPCEVAVAGADSTYRAHCARLTVPVDHDAGEGGPTLELALALVPPSGGRAEPDPVVFLAGGPGQSALDAWPQVARGFSQAARRRHVLLVDQRGTGRSSPLRCEVREGETLDPLGDAVDPAAMARWAEECLQGTEVDARHFTTVDAVRDLEAVRRAVGAPTLNLVGGSYGTRVAQEYLRRYPDAVRTVVLDGVVPPTLALGSEHAVNLEATLDAHFARCREDEACRERFGDPKETLLALRERLTSQPLEVTYPHPTRFEPVTRRLEPMMLTGLVRMFTYQPETAALLPLLVREAQEGRAGPLMAQAEGVLEALEAAIHRGMELSVICSEDAHRLPEPGASGAGLFLGEALLEVLAAVCPIWPSKPPPASFHQLVSSEVPTLLLSGELDPVTPPRYGEEVAAGLSRARHLVAPGQGHLVLIRGCLPRLLGRFVDSADPEGLDVECVERLGATPIFLDHNGGAP